MEPEENKEPVENEEHEDCGTEGCCGECVDD